MPRAFCWQTRVSFIREALIDESIVSDVRKRGMKLVSTQHESQNDDPRSWIGGEAAVGAQARSYIRRQAGPPASLLGVILGLTFLGGLALGSSFGLLCRDKHK